MKSFLIKSYSTIVLHWKKIFFSVLIFCFISGSNLKVTHHYNISVWDFTLLSITDQYYLMFCALPVLIWFIFASFPQHSYLEITRHKYFYSYFFKEFLQIAIFNLVPVLCSIIIGMISKLPITSSFSKEFMKNSTSGSILQVLNEHFHSSVIVIVCTTVYSVIGFVFLSVILQYVLYLFSRKTSLLLTIAGYMVAVFAVQKNVDESFPYVFINNYLIITQILSKGSVWICLLIILAVLVIITFCLQKRLGCKNI